MLKLAEELNVGMGKCVTVQRHSQGDRLIQFCNENNL